MDGAVWVAGLQGLATGLGLIVAIGAQNAHVLRYGIRGEQVLAVVTVCILSDVLLIMAGVFGLGEVLTRSATALTVVRYAGAAVLAGYGVLAVRRAIVGERLTLSAESGRRGLGAAIATTLALTWLNPHVYLDTVLLLGSVAAGKGDGLRWAFGIGACIGSVLWFSALGFGARLLRGVFARPTAWRVLDSLIALIMFIMAAVLVLGR